MAPRWAWLVALVAALVAKFYVVVVGVRVDVRERVAVVRDPPEIARLRQLP